MKKRREIRDYDDTDTAGWIDSSRPVTLKKLGLKLPPVPPTQIVSIRLPTSLLNRLRSVASAQDVPYQALIKIFLANSVRKKAA